MTPKFMGLLCVVAPQYRSQMVGNRMLVSALCLTLASCAYGLGIVDVGSSRVSSTDFAKTTCSGTQIGYSVVGNCSTGPTTTLTQSGSGGHWGMMVGVFAGAHSTSVEREMNLDSGEVRGEGSAAGGLAEVLIETIGGIGNWGIGVRAGLLYRFSDNLDFDGDDRVDASTGYAGLPFSLHAYHGLGPVSVHVGVGTDGFALGDVLRLLTGVRVPLTSSDSGVTLLVLDFDHLRYEDNDGKLTSFGVIAGLAFVR